MDYFPDFKKAELFNLEDQSLTFLISPVSNESNLGGRISKMDGVESYLLGVFNGSGELKTFFTVSGKNISDDNVSLDNYRSELLVSIPTSNGVMKSLVLDFKKYNKLTWNILPSDPQGELPYPLLMLLVREGVVITIYQFLATWVGNLRRHNVVQKKLVVTSLSWFASEKELLIVW